MGLLNRLQTMLINGNIFLKKNDDLRYSQKPSQTGPMYTYTPPLVLSQGDTNIFS